VDQNIYIPSNASHSCEAVKISKMPWTLSFCDALINCRFEICKSWKRRYVGLTFRWVPLLRSWTCFWWSWSLTKTCTLHKNRKKWRKLARIYLPCPWQFLINFGHQRSILIHGEKTPLFKVHFIGVMSHEVSLLWSHLQLQTFCWKGYWFAKPWHCKLRWKSAWVVSLPKPWKSQGTSFV